MFTAIMETGCIWQELGMMHETEVSTQKNRQNNTIAIKNLEIYG